MKCILLKDFILGESDALYLDVDWFDNGDILGFHFDGDFYTLIIQSMILESGISYKYNYTAEKELVVKNGIWNVGLKPNIKIGNYMYHVGRKKEVKAVQDDSGDWFIIPSNEMKDWDYYNNEYLDNTSNQYGQDCLEIIEDQYGKYRVGGDLNLKQLYI